MAAVASLAALSIGGVSSDGGRRADQSRSAQPTELGRTDAPGSRARSGGAACGGKASRYPRVSLPINPVPECVILGGGGHARMLIDCLDLAADPWQFAVLDADRSLWGKTVLGVRVLGNDELLEKLAS